MSGIHITDIEAAINWWRERQPSTDGLSACPEVQALAEVYGLLVYHRDHECDEDSMPAVAKAAWLRWYDSTPDAPCIAICSTSQGAALCKGCGRTFDEVQHWPVMTPAEKRITWRRITQEGTAWRFNRYAERAREFSGLDHPQQQITAQPPAEAP
ncbi:MAG: Fe-S protein [Burkholderiales bacterium PBB2]|nr:MAG: Fe-S protein [Burkholderiales bacterium PBB2]